MREPSVTPIEGIFDATIHVYGRRQRSWIVHVRHVVTEQPSQGGPTKRTNPAARRLGCHATTTGIGAPGQQRAFDRTRSRLHGTGETLHCNARDRTPGQRTADPSDERRRGGDSKRQAGISSRGTGNQVGAKSNPSTVPDRGGEYQDGRRRRWIHRGNREISRLGTGRRGGDPKGSRDQHRRQLGGIRPNVRGASHHEGQRADHAQREHAQQPKFGRSVDRVGQGKRAFPGPNRRTLGMHRRDTALRSAIGAGVLDRRADQSVASHGGGPGNTARPAHSQESGAASGSSP
mmetsp:Transcript_19678/g.48955  ORF Transcript_19678/g.48955 Transcript_19678/m.48955 type:complete len:290 (-) Transcript_19678:293-1162(-)